MKKINDHLKESNTTYTEHFKWAVYAGFILIGAGIASIIHAVIPSLFEGTAAKTIIKMFYRRLYNHSSKNYQYKIMKEMKRSKN